MDSGGLYLEMCPGRWVRSLWTDVMCGIWFEDVAWVLGTINLGSFCVLCNLVVWVWNVSWVLGVIELGSSFVGL